MLWFEPTVRPRAVYFGLDLGQRGSQSAIVAVERIHEISKHERHPYSLKPKESLTLVARGLKTFRLGLSYMEVINKVAHLASGEGTLFGFWPLERGHYDNPVRTLVVDESGIGAPVLDVLKAKMHSIGRSGAEVVPVTILPAGTPSRSKVSRADLLTNLRLVMEYGFLQIPKELPELQELIDELTQVRQRKSSQQDDRVMALALAVWLATYPLNDLIRRFIDAK